MTLKVVSLFSGIEGIGLGLERAGMETIAQVEIDKFCNKVLERRYPNVPRYRDVREYLRGDGPVPDADVVTGGVPCQDISVAGKRAGLGGERSGLFFEFVRIVDRIAPTWVLFENVAGLLSSKSSASASLEGEADGDDDDAADYHAGEDFAVLLGELTGFRPAVPDGGWRSAGLCVGPKRAAAWRRYDSQYFGVAQRRKRVFVVCHPRVEIAAAVLFDAEGGQGNPAPQRKAGEAVAGTLGLGSFRGSWRGVRTTDLDGNGAYIPEIAYAVRASQEKQNGSPERGDITLIAMAVDGSGVANTLKRDDGYVSEDGTGRQPGFVVEREVAAPLTGGGHPNSNIPSRHMEDDVNLVATYNVQPVKGERDTLEAHDTATSEAVLKVGGSRRSDRGTMAVVVERSVDSLTPWPEMGEAMRVYGTKGASPSLKRHNINIFTDELRVRRLTVTEQERLQGFPDGWTCLEDGPYDSYNCRCPDAPRVGAIGNAVTVNVAQHIGKRMVSVGSRDT